jgi:membrane-bound lytic murein transglycosylase B
MLVVAAAMAALPFDRGIMGCPADIAAVPFQLNQVIPVSPATARGGADLVASPPAAAGQTQTSPPPDTRPAFVDWLADVRKEALSRGIRQDVVDAALSDIEEPLPVVLERDRAQAEIVLPLEGYLRRRLTPKFIRAGREAYARQRTLLESIGKAYGVAPSIIAAIWGVESNYGRFSGVRPTVAALATLAWDPRRSAFFRGELFDALEILNNGDIDFANMKGSWAGAMGQVQFMPSSYLQYAEDYDGDGHRDIWSTPADVIASIANYLSGRGWKGNETWGREVRVSPEVLRGVTNTVERRNGTCRATRDMTVPLAPRRWQELGVRLANGKPLPASMPDASLVSGSKQHFLVYSNYDALLEYNCAHSYAISVGLLADRIGTTGAAVPRARRPKRR